MVSIENNLTNATAVAIPNLPELNPHFPGQILQFDQNARFSSSGSKTGIADEAVSGEIRMLTS